jgi:hypothetical protein
VEQLQLSPDDPGVVSLLLDYGRRVNLHSGDFPALLREIHALEQRLRQYAIQRPDPDRVHALLESVYPQGSANRWMSEETETAIKMAEPSTIVAITWSGARTADGRELSRESVRAGMRTAAYSDDSWRKYLATLPPIAAPETL